MPTIGPNDLKAISLPAGIDQTVLRNFTLRSGQTYDGVVREINTALTMARDAVMAGPLFDMVHMTEEQAVEYRIGTNKTFERSAEYSQPDSQMADVTGHMLPLVTDDHKLGWTTRFLEDARQSRIDADIAASIQAYKDRLEQAVLTRLFKATSDTGKVNGLGSGSGVSVPFADGGTADSTYVPMQMPSRAAAFASTHTHFLRLNGITQANLETAVTHIWEHGHDGPYDLLASEADSAAWQNTTNVTGFVGRDYGLVNNATTTATAQVAGKYLGVIKTARGPVRLWTSARIPTTYWSVYKSYGRDDVRNPLWMRTDPMWGNTPRLIVENVSRFPLAGAIVQIRYGVGLGEDRTSAVMVLNAGSGSYTSPTIS